MEREAAISPDGTLVAYTSDETGSREVFVTRFPEGSGKWKASSGGGSSPDWSRKTGDLYYESSSRIWEVPVTTEPTVSIGTPTELFYSASLSRDWDVSNDGQRFLMIRDHVPEGGGRSVVLVSNWAAAFADSGP